MNGLGDLLLHDDLFLPRLETIPNVYFISSNVSMRIIRMRDSDTPSFSMSLNTIGVTSRSFSTSETSKRATVEEDHNLLQIRHLAQRLFVGDEDLHRSSVDHVRAEIKHSVPGLHTTPTAYQMYSVTSMGRMLMKRQRNQWNVRWVSEMSFVSKWSVNSGSFSLSRYRKMRSSTRMPIWSGGEKKEYQFVGKVVGEQDAIDAHLRVESELVVHIRQQECRDEVHGLAVTAFHYIITIEHDYIEVHRKPPSALREDRKSPSPKAPSYLSRKYYSRKKNRLLPTNIFLYLDSILACRIFARQCYYVLVIVLPTFFAQIFSATQLEPRISSPLLTDPTVLLNILIIFCRRITQRPWNDLLAIENRLNKKLASCQHSAA